MRRHLRLVANGLPVLADPDQENTGTDATPLNIKRISIRGITTDGRKFRPSNWAERLYYAVATYGPNRTVTFNPLVTLKVEADRINCVVVDIKLQDEEPMLFDFLIGFARDNKLEMLDQERNPISAV